MGHTEWQVASSQMTQRRVTQPRPFGRAREDFSEEGTNEPFVREDLEYQMPKREELWKGLVVCCRARGTVRSTPKCEVGCELEKGKNKG